MPTLPYEAPSSLNMFVSSYVSVSLLYRDGNYNQNPVDRVASGVTFASPLHVCKPFDRATSGVTFTSLSHDCSPVDRAASSISFASFDAPARPLCYTHAPAENVPSPARSMLPGCIPLGRNNIVAPGRSCTSRDGSSAVPPLDKSCFFLCLVGGWASCS